MGFSPFELLNGRTVRGPLNLLRQNCEQEFGKDPRAVVIYVGNLLNILRSALKAVGEILQKVQQKQKNVYDWKARERIYEPGDKVLVLRPVKENKLQLAWTGPVKIILKMNDINYIVKRDDGVLKWCTPI